MAAVKIQTASEFKNDPEAEGYYVVSHFRGKRRTKKFETEEAAKDFADQLIAHIKVLGTEAHTLLGTGRSRKIPGFKRYAAKCLMEMEASDLKESTVQRYASSIKTHLTPYFGRLDLDQITWQMMKEFCIEKQPTNSKHGIRLMVAAMGVIMEEAVREDLIPKNPAKRLGRFFGTGTKGRGEKMPFNRKELRKVLSIIIDKWPEYYEFVLAAARAGLTFGEARILTWPDILFRSGPGKRSFIHVTRSWSYGRPITTPKTKARIRKIEVSKELEVALKKLRARRKEEYLAQGKTKIPDLVFVSKKGMPIAAPNFIARVWQPAMREANLDYRNWHNLRHTFASQLLMAGENILYVQRQLGHARLSTTQNHYAKWIDEENEDQGRGVDVLDDVEEK